MPHAMLNFAQHGITKVSRYGKKYHDKHTEPQNDSRKAVWRLAHRRALVERRSRGSGCHQQQTNTTDQVDAESTHMQIRLSAGIVDPVSENCNGLNCAVSLVCDVSGQIHT